MKNLKDITEKELQKIKVVTFDIDGVIIPTGTELRENQDGTEFYMKSKQLSRKFIEDLKKLKKYVRLNFSSGRNILYLKSLVNEIFDSKIILQAENGNIIWIDGKIIHSVYPDNYFDTLRDIKEDIKSMMKDDKRIRGFEPKMFILTVHCDRMKEILNIVKQRDPKNKLYCLWTNEGYDIGSIKMSKGRGIINLAKYLGIGKKQIMTSGNNYNDKEMLKVGKGISLQPDKVKAEYFIMRKSGELGGELLLEVLLKYYTNQKRYIRDLN